jgi:hypothetical protein
MNHCHWLSALETFVPNPTHPEETVSSQAKTSVFHLIYTKETVSSQAKASVSHLIYTKETVSSQAKESTLLEIQSAPKKRHKLRHRELRNTKVVAQNKGVTHTVTVSNPETDPIRLAVGRGADLRRE